MDTRETNIYNHLVETLFNLEMEGTEIREEIVEFDLENILKNQELLIDPEINDRITILADSSNIAVEVLDRIAISAEQGFEEGRPGGGAFRHGAACGEGPPQGGGRPRLGGRGTRAAGVLRGMARQ